MAAKLHILHIEDGAADAELIRQTLLRSGLDCTVSLATSRAEYTQGLQGGGIDLILSDVRGYDFDGLEVLRMAQCAEAVEGEGPPSSSPWTSVRVGMPGDRGLGGCQQRQHHSSQIKAAVSMQPAYAVSSEAVRRVRAPSFRRTESTR